MIGRSRVSRNGRLAVGVAALAVFGFGAPLRALAQDAPSQDPPSRVGYIALVEGTVSMHPSASDPWAPATVNYPMAAGTSLWTEPGAKAEIQIGAARVDLDGGTEVDIVSVDGQNVDINVPQGRADVHLHGRQQNENYEVTAPRGTVALNTDGTYRIIAGDDQAPTRIGALYGTAQLLEPSGTVPVDTNNELVVSSGDPLQYTQQAVQDDGFDHWVADRSHRFERPVAHRHVSPQMVGADNLDQYGTWQTSPQYGAVWEPSAVAADWAPYRDGHWRWVAPWGWTWVDDEPWGFAPFHYGRWAQVDDRWAWVPGTVVEQPVYAPALVAFVGGSPEPEFGIGVSVGIGFGIGAAIGWVPLGPGEVYEPPYRVSDRYIRNVNITNVSQTTINNISVNKTVNVTNVNYVNQRAVTVVNRDAFVNAQPVRHAALPQAQAAKFTHPIVASAAPGRAAAAPLPSPTVASRVGAEAAAHPVQAPPQPKVQMPVTRVAAQGRVVPTAVPAAPAQAGPVAAAVGSHTGPGSVAPPAAGPGAVAQPHPPAAQAVAGTPRPGTQPTGVPQPHPMAPASANAGSRTGAVPQPHPLGAAPASGVPQPVAQRPGVPQPHPINPVNAAARPNPAPAPHATAPHATVPTPPPVANSTANSMANSAARPTPAAQPHPSAPLNTAARYPTPQPNAGAAQAVPHPAAPANTPTRYPAPRPSPAPQAQMPAAAAPRPSVQARPQPAPQPAPRAQYQSPPRPQPQAAPRAQAAPQPAPRAQYQSPPRPQPQAAPRAQAAPQPARTQPQPRPTAPPPNKKDDHKT